MLRMTSEINFWDTHQMGALLTGPLPGVILSVAKDPLVFFLLSVLLIDGLGSDSWVAKRLPRRAKENLK